MFDDARLSLMETGYRSCLDEDPVDHDARMNLAWCLLLRSVARTACANNQEQPKGESRRMLEESLQEMRTTTYLSSSPVPRAEMRRLQTLVTEVGEGTLVRNAEEKITQSTMRLLYALHSNLDAV